MEVDLKANAEETNYILLSGYQNPGQNRNLKTANRFFENLAKFRHLGMTVTNKNLICEEIKSRLNSGNVCYHSGQKLIVFSSAV
jgi:hypothetical protein